MTQTSSNQKIGKKYHVTFDLQPDEKQLNRAHRERQKERERERETEREREKERERERERAHLEDV